MDDAAEGSVNWYASKRAIVARLDGIVERLATAGVAPDTVTLAALPVAVAGGICIAISPLAPIALVLVPVAAGLRLFLNLIDGALAARPAVAIPGVSCSTRSAIGWPISP